MTLKEKFKENQDENPDLTSLVNFSLAIQDVKTNKREVLREFDRLVDPTDFFPEEREEILQCLFDFIQ